MSVADVLAGRARWAIEQGDVLDRLAELPDNSVNCVITSPPYWGLRDYGTARWEGGDDPACTHRVRPAGSGMASVGIDGGRASQGHQQEGYRGRCRRCGARRIDRQIGLEDSLSAYVERLVAVFREVRRVLRADATCWVNLGDAYAQGRGRKADAAELAEDAERAREKEYPTQAFAGYAGWQRATGTAVEGLKPKDLIGMPWRVALALQADGWWLRSDIIWAKPNPMPESVTDRPTRSHEYLFLLTKSSRYWYDADAIAEKALSEPGELRVPDGWAEGPSDHSVVGHSLRSRDNFARATKEAEVPGQPLRQHRLDRAPTFAKSSRNRRSVWTIPTEAFPEAHFATFPTALVEPCILAGCPAGGVVLDPFAGSGTTLMVALRHGRRAIGVELNPRYVEMASRRIFLDSPMFNGQGEAAG